MRSSAVVVTPEADALAIRMAKHFGRKVAVDVADGVTRIAIPAGRFELEPREAQLVVRAEADDEDGLARVQEVAESHLARFARGGEVELRWSNEALEDRAVALVSAHRNGRHLVRTRDWVLELRADASDALRLAALLHDVDRDLGGVSLDEQVAAWDDGDALRAHAERSAEIASGWLRDEGAGDALAEAVAELVRLHETGGSGEADVLQAADSISFLEVNPARRWVREGLASASEAERKLRWMRDRIRLPDARACAASLLERALQELVRDVSTGQDSAPASRARHANEGRAHGNTG